jgi:hypothetical protein
VPSTDQFRAELFAQIERAAEQRRPHVEINAGELHRMVGGYPPTAGEHHAMPTCCNVMREEFNRGNCTVVYETESGQAAALTIRYHLPRAATVNLGEYDLSPSGVRISRDFRSNLIIDRYDPVFADMRAKKRKHLQSANSEDAVTWNVFRSLRQINPQTWMPVLWQRAFPSIPCPPDHNAVVRLWESIPPPPALLVGGDEGPSEIDVVIEAPTWVWFLEAKYRSDISLRTTTRPERDQVLRNIDVGSYYAGARPFFFSLVILSESCSPKGAQRIRDYTDFSDTRKRLQEHRLDALRNLTAIGQLTWAEFAEVLSEASTAALRDDERAYAARAVTWLQGRVLRG